MDSASEAGGARRFEAAAGLFMLASDEGDFAGDFAFAFPVDLMGGCDEAALVPGEGDATGDFFIAL